jgi:hypothetical protein
MIYGYARVSTDGQTLDAQVAALTAAGAQKVYQEKVSGAKTDRAALAKAVSNRTSAMDARTTRHPGYAISQQKRKRTEEPIGWGTLAGSPGPRCAEPRD